MAKKENTSAAAKVAKAEKQAAKGAEDSKLCLLYTSDAADE